MQRRDLFALANLFVCFGLALYKLYFDSVFDVG